jgi:hypothetical protein
MELKTIQKFLDEIDYLKKRSKLLEHILHYYDTETMTFIIPDEYKNTYLIINDKLKQIPKSPRHRINKCIYELLPYSENNNLVNHYELYKTLADK